MNNTLWRCAFLILTVLLTSSCAIDDGIPRFERMSDAELEAYNHGKPLAQMIVCNDGERNFSRVRRRTCATVEAMYGSTQQADKLGVLNTIQGYVGE